MKDNEEEKYTLRRNGGVILYKRTFVPVFNGKTAGMNCMTGVHVLRRMSLPIAIHANSCEEKVLCTVGVHENKT